MKDFEEELDNALKQLPYTPHVDDGQYNDGKIVGFEEGARWTYQEFSKPKSEMLLASGKLAIAAANVVNGTLKNFEQRLTALEEALNEYNEIVFKHVN